MHGPGIKTHGRRYDGENGRALPTGIAHDFSATSHLEAAFTLPMYITL